jgi:tetratricopeptide (TPR) repeat protein
VPTWTPHRRKACYGPVSYDTAKHLGEPATLAHALMNIGVELDRADRKQEAVEHLEHARDVSFRANKAWAALIHSYLSRIYASSGESLRFQRASETAQTLAISLPAYENGEEAVFYNMSGVLAERSYGYMEIGKPEMTLAMKDEIMRQIRLDHNTRLETWVFLDWARAYLMLHEVEEGVKAAQEFLWRVSILQSDHAPRRVCEYLEDLENAGYADIPVVRGFREELKDTGSSSSSGEENPDYAKRRNEDRRTGRVAVFPRSKYGVPVYLEDGRLNPEYRKRLHHATSHVHYEDNRLKGWQRRGISIDSYGQFLTLLAMAQYQCEICDTELTEKSAHLDHDHTLGKMRVFLARGAIMV